MDLTTGRDLLRHMEWADAAALAAVLRTPGAGADERVVARLHHLHLVQWAYLQVWRGEPIAIPELSTLGGVSGLTDRVRRYYRDLPAFVSSLEDASLGRPVVFPWAAQLVERFGPPGPVTLGESILQVAMHSAYHRGQLATDIRALGGEPPLTDYVAWLWRQRPDPEWSAVE